MATCCLALGFKGESKIKRQLDRHLVPLVLFESVLIVAAISLVVIGLVQYHSASQHIMLRGRTNLFIGCGILGSITFLIGLGGAIHYHQVSKGIYLTAEEERHERDFTSHSYQTATRRAAEIQAQTSAALNAARGESAARRAAIEKKINDDARAGTTQPS